MTEVPVVLLRDVVAGLTVGTTQTVPGLDSLGNLIQDTSLVTDINNAAALIAEGDSAYPLSAATNVPRGVSKTATATSPGSGGATGTFAFSWTGGNFSNNPAGTFTVVGGAFVSYSITGRGRYIGNAPVAPTPSFAACAGLSGASITLPLEFLVPSGGGYWVTSADGLSYNHYINNAGVATADAGAAAIPTNAAITSIQRGIHILTANTGTDGLSYSATGPAWVTSLSVGLYFLWTPPVDNTGAVQLNINTIGLKNINDANDQALMSGMIQGNHKYIIYYATGGSFRLIVEVRTTAKYDMSILHELSFGTPAAPKARFAVSGLGELEQLSWILGSMQEGARFDSATGRYRAKFGFSIGTTAGSSKDVYWPGNPQTVVPAYVDALVAAQNDANSSGPADIDNSTPVPITLTTPYYVTANDCRRVYYASVNSAFLDCTFLPIGLEVEIAASPASTGLQLYAGLGQTWGAAYSSDTVLTLSTGGSVKLMRLGANDFRVRLATGTTVTHASPAVAARARHYVMLGQSNAARFLAGSGLYGLQKGFGTLGITDSFWFTQAAVGQSSLFKSNTAAAGNYWWDDTTDLPGPRTLDAVIAINASLAAGQPKPNVMLWDNGEAQVGFMSASGFCTHSTCKATMEKIFQYIKTHCSIDLSDVKIGIIPQGADDTSNDVQKTAVREYLISFIATNPTKYFLAQDRYDLDRLSGNVHQSYVGFVAEGIRMAAVIGNVVFGQSNFLGPKIYSFTQLTANTVKVEVDCTGSSSASLFEGKKLATGTCNARGFGLCSNTEAVSATFYTITSITRFFNSGTNRHEFTITTVEDSTGCRPVFPLGCLADARNGLLITHFITGLPIQSFSGIA